MAPIFHLSLPVRDLDEAVEFYRSTLQADVGRRTERFADVFVFGGQVTLHDDPGSVTAPMPRTRHFGWTMPWSQWEALADTYGGASYQVEAPTISYVGEPIEQGKLMLSDPSGNLIEIKAYRHPERVLGSLVT